MRDIKHPEQVKVLMAEVFRGGQETDREWSARYERLKKVAPVEEMGRLIAVLHRDGLSIDEAREHVKKLVLKQVAQNEAQQN